MQSSTIAIFERKKIYKNFQLLNSFQFLVIKTLDLELDPDSDPLWDLHPDPDPHNPAQRDADWIQKQYPIKTQNFGKVVFPFLWGGGGNQNTKTLLVVKRLQAKLQDIKISKFYQFLHMFQLVKYFFLKPEPMGSDMLGKIKRELVLWDQ
jgi:hypothetical protein